MDFARKQLEKYGWKDGDGLGKTSQGIAVAIKPRLKTGKEGMGFDLCQELTGTWWTKAYSDSLRRISVKGSAEDGELLAVSIKEDDEVKGKTRGPYQEHVEERPMEKMRKRMMKANFTSFSKGGTLSNGEMLGDDEDSPPDSNSNSGSNTPVIKFLSDEELLKACGGRTAHKAARFGLKLNGKLARIAAQDQVQLITPTDSPEEDDSGNNKQKKSKKKRKREGKSDAIVKLSESELSEVIIGDVENNASDCDAKKKKNSSVEDIESNVTNVYEELGESEKRKRNQRIKGSSKKLWKVNDL